MALGDTDAGVGDVGLPHDDASSAGNSPGEEPSLAVSRSRRSTAGARMSALIDAEADDELALLFAEDENDTEFEIGRRGQRDGVRHGGVEGEEGEEFNDDDDDDEDVDMSSSSDDDEDKGPNAPEGEDLEGEKELQQRTRAEARKKKKKADENLRLMALRKRAIVTSAAARTSRDVRKEESQKDAAAVQQPPGAATEEESAATALAKKRKKPERVSWLPGVDDLPRRSSSRRQTMANKEQTHARLKSSEEKRVRLIATMERAAKRKEKLKAIVMTQADRLEEAERTERLNSKSLNRWEEMERKRIEEQQERLRALQDRRLEGAVFTYWSGPAKWVDGKLAKVGVTEVREQHEPLSKKRKAKDAPGEEKVSKLSKVTDGPTLTTTGLSKTQSEGRPTTATIEKVEQEPSSALSGSTSFPYSSRPQSQGQSQSAGAETDSLSPDADTLSSQLMSGNGHQTNSGQLPANSLTQLIHPATQQQPQDTSVMLPSREKATGEIIRHQETQQSALLYTSTPQAGVPGQTLEIQGSDVRSFDDIPHPNQPAVTINEAIRRPSSEAPTGPVTQNIHILPSMHAHTIPLPVSFCLRPLRDHQVGSNQSQQIYQAAKSSTDTTTATEQDQPYPHPSPIVPQAMATEVPPHEPLIEYSSRESYIFTDIDGLTRDQKANYAVLLEPQNPVESAPARAVPVSRSRSVKPLKSNKPTIELCPITSKPAKYRDPLTSLAYASALAYKEIRGTSNHRYAWSTLLGCFCGPIGVGARGVPERFLAPNTAPKDINVIPDSDANTEAIGVEKSEKPQDQALTVGIKLNSGPADQQQKQQQITSQASQSNMTASRPSLGSIQSDNAVSIAPTTPVPLSQSVSAQQLSTIAPATTSAAPLPVLQPSTSPAIPPVASSAVNPLPPVQAASTQSPVPKLAAQESLTSSPAPIPAPSAPAPVAAAPVSASISQIPVAASTTEHVTAAPVPPAPTPTPTPAPTSTPTQQSSQQ